MLGILSLHIGNAFTKYLFVSYLRLFILKSMHK